jgi:hypothetical protein
MTSSNLLPPTTLLNDILARNFGCLIVVSESNPMSAEMQEATTANEKAQKSSCIFLSR